jgi:hypothetical protein
VVEMNEIRRKKIELYKALKEKLRRKLAKIYGDATATALIGLYPESTLAIKVLLKHENLN